MKIPEGWKLVPVEPTTEMLLAARYQTTGWTDYGYYKAMVAAAPTPPVSIPEPGSWIPVQAAIDDYLDGYECDDGESICHSPTEFEAFLITDAIAGLLNDEKFREEFGKWPGQKTPTPPAQEADANVCTSTSPDAHKTGNIDDKQEINYALISKHRELGWTVSDSVYKAHIAQVLPLQKQPEVTVTTTAQEAEPYAYAYKSSSDPRPSVYFEKMDFFPPSIQEIPLYTNAPSDKLRQAAEEVLNSIHEEFLYSNTLSRRCWAALDGLRSVLKGKS